MTLGVSSRQDTPQPTEDDEDRAADDNWYSSDEEGAPPLTAVLKQISSAEVSLRARCAKWPEQTLRPKTQLMTNYDNTLATGHVVSQVLMFTRCYVKRLAQFWVEFHLKERFRSRSPGY